MTRNTVPLSAAWGLVGILAILLRATLSLADRGVSTIEAGLHPLELAALVALTIFFIVTEGVAAFQRKWVPRVVARLVELGRRRNPVHHVLAPLFGMMLIGAPRRTLVRAWAGVIAIVGIVLVVRVLPSPWRGIIDFGVAAALAWGSVALAIQAVRALRGDHRAQAAPGS